MKKILFPLIVVAIIAGAVGLMIYGNKTSNSMSNLSFSGDDDAVVSQEGIHFHPQLAIYIRGQKQEITPDIGIGQQYSGNMFYDSMMSMTDIHTHDDSGTLHWEVMQGPTKKGHLKLGNFFDIWGKVFNSRQIFDLANTDGDTVKMTVNGAENMEFENYLVKDGDIIEVRYE